jgi:hypothetical protein
MIALNQNYFNLNLDYSIPNLQSGFLTAIKSYISTLKELYSLNKFLQISIYNIEIFLLINGADSVDKIDDILIKLEDISEISSELLEENRTLGKWYNYPLRYMIEKVETSNMSLQAMLGSQQAQFMHKNRDDNRENTKI